MRASKLITVSTAAVLIGGTSLVVGHSLQSAWSQNHASTQAGAATSEGMTTGSNRQAAEQGAKLPGSRQSQRAPATSTQHARAPIGERGQELSTERFRHHQAFLYRDKIVLVDPATSRIVAVLPA